jgi:hypothetical protein
MYIVAANYSLQRTAQVEKPANDCMHQTGRAVNGQDRVSICWPSPLVMHAFAGPNGDNEMDSGIEWDVRPVSDRANHDLLHPRGRNLDRHPIGD